MAAKRKPAAKAPARKPAAKSAAKRKTASKVVPPALRKSNRTKLGAGRPDDRDADGCLASEARFVLEYLKDSNGTQAAIRAGYSARTAHVQGTHIMARPHVRAAIERRQAKLREKLEISTERVLEEFARIAFASLRGLFHEDGTVKRLEEIDADTMAAISSIEPTEYGRKVRMHAKHPALDALARHLGVFKEDNKQKGDAIAALLQDIGNRDAGLPVKP